MAYLEGITIATYMMFRDRDGNAIRNRAYQNLFLGETRTFGDYDYLFAPFGIQGSLGGAVSSASTASITMPANILTVAFASEAVLNRWLLGARYISIAMQDEVGPVYTEGSILAEDLWLCADFRFTQPMLDDSETVLAVTLELQSPLNAVDARTPMCKLQDWQVGSLPVTGNLLLT